MNKFIFKLPLVLTVVLLGFIRCKNKDIQNLNQRATATTTAKAKAIINLGCPNSPAPFNFKLINNGDVIVNRNITLKTGNTYILNNYFRVQNGKTITIEPGVTIKGNYTGTGCSIAPGTLVIERGAKIQASGTASQPIVFTSNDNRPEPGDWGGVVVLGRASVNIRQNSFILGTRNGIGAINGLPVPNNTGLYGSIPAVNNDNSGTLRYIRIEYAGDNIGEDNNLNGLTLGGVGSGTTLEYIQVSFSFADGFGFFGGTVNGKYLVANRNSDDDFDTDQGYKGNLQFGVAIREPRGKPGFLYNHPINGIETNGDQDIAYLNGPNDYTSANLSNFTVIGPYQNNCGENVHLNYSSGIYLRDNSDQNLYNSVIFGFNSGIRISDDTGAANFNTSAIPNNSLIDVKNTTLVVPAEGDGFATLDDATDTDFDAAFLRPALNNSILEADGCIKEVDMAAAAGLSASAWSGIFGVQPNLNPLAGSSLLGSASFTNINSNSFFTVVNYRGAFAENDNWLNGWTNWSL
ncbi:MAG: hypothetical protein ACK5H1_04105 [Tenacibaculum sp.]